MNLFGMITSAFNFFAGHPPLTATWSGPYLVEAPRRIVVPEFQETPITMAGASIHNHSSSTMRDVCIQLPYRPDFFDKEAVECDSDLPEGAWQYDHQRKEIRIAQISPKEKIYFNIFSKAETTGYGSRSARFLVGGKLISGRSKFLGDFYFLGVQTRLITGMSVAVMTIAVGMAAWSYQRSVENERVHRLMAQSNVFMTCTPKILSKTDGTLNYAGLRQHKLGGVEGAISHNGGRDLEELLSRDEVLICSKLNELTG